MLWKVIRAKNMVAAYLPWPQKKNYICAKSLHETQVGQFKTQKWKKVNLYVKLDKKLENLLKFRSRLLILIVDYIRVCPQNVTWKSFWMAGLIFEAHPNWGVW